jgi:hypothetical protein
MESDAANLKYPFPVFRFLRNSTCLRLEEVHFQILLYHVVLFLCVSKYINIYIYIYITQIKYKKTATHKFVLQGTQLKSGPYFNISNLFTTCYITQITRIYSKCWK